MVSEAKTPQKANQAQLARILNVARQSVNELVARGVLSIDKNGLIDVELAKVAIKNRVRPSSKTSKAATGESQTGHKTTGEDDGATNFHVARTLREAAEARIAQLKLEEMQGKLIREDAVQAAVASACASTRERLYQIPIRVATVIAAESSPEKIYELLQNEIEQALSQLSSLEKSSTDNG